MLRDGRYTYEHIRKACGVSIGTVCRIADDLGLSGIRKKRKVEKIKRVHEEAKKGGSYSEIGRRAGTSTTSTRDYVRIPPPTADTPSEGLPDSHYRDSTEYHLDTPGRWLVLSDIHLPCHDRQAVELAVSRAKIDGVAGVILNGDLLDSHEISDHDKDPSAPRYVQEIEYGVRFWRWLREQLPTCRLVYKLGNHEERLTRYVYSRAPALFGLQAVTIQSLLELDAVGVELVADKRVVKLGKLHLVHGHEYRGGGGVNPARWLYLRARSVAMSGHFHRTSEHHARDIAGKYEAAWSTGCLCDLKPLYAPLNEWNHGWAVVEVSNGGDFGVRNLRLVNGQVL
jgi:predicted phosphodiesterase